MSYEINSGGFNNIRAVVPDSCDICDALANQWEENRDRDALIEINNHPHSTPKLKRRVTAWLREGKQVQRQGVSA